MKREECTGIGFGGNKMRKLDYLLHQAVSDRADSLVSGGVIQSNSQRQVAAAAAKLGLECHPAVYHGRVEPPGPDYETSGNALLNELFGAHPHDTPGQRVAYRTPKRSTRSSWRESWRRCRLIRLFKKGARRLDCIDPGRPVEAI